MSLDRDELLAVMQDSLQGLAIELGLLVASAILEDEVTRLCGRRYERQPERRHTRYGHQHGAATLGCQKLPIDRPRVRRGDVGGEVSLETYGPATPSRRLCSVNRPNVYPSLARWLSTTGPGGASRN